MARKATKKVTAAKAKPRKTTVAKPKAKKMVSTAISNAFTKAQQMSYIAEETELTKKQIAEVFDVMNNLMHRHLKKRGVGEFNMAGLMKLVVKRKPATKARKGINPFTGEETMFKAKPARNVVKVRPLKKLKEMVE